MIHKHSSQNHSVSVRYQQCTNCVMDTSAADIIFNEEGICNFCIEFEANNDQIVNESRKNKNIRLDELIQKIKKSGKQKPYDCIVGVSGGVDSSWALVQAKQHGLRPLAVHMDNGWDSELAQNNIARLLKYLDIDLYTHVIDWEEYRALMQAFFDADVIDIELLYDNAMIAVNYAQANKYRLKYILSGDNQATEGMAMPVGWNWFKYDKKNIISIAKKHGVKRITSFPSFGTLDFVWSHFVKQVSFLPFLDYLPYNKFRVLDELEANYGYKRYPYKHYESIFTRFYQGYILPKKFGVDKRMLHLSTLVASGQMTRSDALVGLEGIPYPSEKNLEEDLNYFLKKMRWSKAELNTYIARKEISHSYYPTERPLWFYLSELYKRFN